MDDENWEVESARACEMAVQEEREACARIDPLTVTCDFCKAKVGEMCWGDGRPQLAHDTRKSAAIRARSETFEEKPDAG